LTKSWRQASKHTKQTNPAAEQNKTLNGPRVRRLSPVYWYTF